MRKTFTPTKSSTLRPGMMVEIVPIRGEQSRLAIIVDLDDVIFSRLKWRIKLTYHKIVIWLRGKR